MATRGHTLPAAVLLLLLLAASAFSQEYPLRLYDHPDMLPGVKWGAMQDSRGVLWFWGESGIMSYDGVRFRQYTVEQGLSDNYVYEMVEGPDGLLYIGTFQGLDLFNPTTCQLSPSPVRRGLPARDIEFTPWGMVLAHDDGSSLFRGKGEYLIPVNAVVADPGRPSLTNQVVYDPMDSTLWMAMEPKGLYRVDLPDLLPLFDMKDPAAQEDYEAQGGEVFFAGVNPDSAIRDLWKVQDRAQHRSVCEQVMQRLVPPGEPASWIADRLLLDEKGTLWTAANGNLYKLIDRNLQHIPLATPSTVNYQPRIFLDTKHRYIAGLAGLFVYSQRDSLALTKGLATLHPADLTLCLTDRQGLLWLGWKDGSIGRLLSHHVQLYRAEDHPHLRGMKETLRFTDGSLLLAGPNAIVKAESETFQRVLTPPRLPAAIWDFAVDRRQNILMLTETGMYVYDRRRDRVRTLRSNMRSGANNQPAVQGPDGLLWFIARDTIYTWDGDRLVNTGDRFQHSTFLYADPDSSLWLGTWNGPVKLKDGQAWQYLEDRFRYAGDFPKRNWENLVLFPDSLFEGGFSALCCEQTSDSAYWFGTFSTGIIRIKGDSLRIFNRDDGIPQVRYRDVYKTPEGDLVFYASSVVVRIENGRPVRQTYPLASNTEVLLWREDEQRRVYLATSRGLQVMDGPHHVLLNREFGLPANRVNDLAVRQDGRVLAIQDEAILCFDPDSLFQGSTAAARPFVARVRTKSGVQPQNTPLRLPLGERAVTFELALPDFRNESQTRFAWRLSPFDDAGHWRGGKQSATYENLPPGEYRFVLTAGDSRGETVVMPEPFVIIVPPYFHETLWFKGLLILLVIVGFVLVLRWRVRRIERQKEILQRLVEEKTAEALESHERAKKAEINAKQLETANQLAATIAHEFNNPLAIIKGSIDLLRMKIVPEDQVEKQYDVLDATIKRLATLVDKLLKLRTLKEIHYADGMKILDIHNPDDPEPPDEHPSSEEPKR